MKVAVKILLKPLNGNEKSLYQKNKDNMQIAKIVEYS